MVEKCTSRDEARLLDFLRQEAVFNTFLLADIENYGFDQEFQTVYADMDGEAVRNVYLRFYGNLIVAGEAESLDGDFVRKLTADWKPDVVMGKAQLVEAVGRFLTGYEMAEKNLYLLECGDALLDETELLKGVGMRRGVPGDEDRIHAFLMGIPEIRALYASKEMIADRLRTGDGTHLFLERDGELIAHVNSAAKSPYTVMLGGAAVSRTERGRGLESVLVSVLCREILAEGKKPCCFSDRGEDHNLFVHIGFQCAGKWGTLTPRKQEEGKGRLPSYIPVYNRLFQDLMDGVYEKDSLLPSENVLAAAYKVSRNTLRQALTILAQDGYIYKRQGKGTFVSYDCRRKEKKKLYNFLRECAKEPVSRVTMDYNVGLPTNIAKQKLELKDREEVLASNNVYWGEEGPIGQSFLQIPMEVLRKNGIVREAEKEGSDGEPFDQEQLLSFMDGAVYQRAESAHMTIQVVAADEQVISYMNIPEGTVLLHMEQILYGQDSRPIARIKYYFIPDQYQVDCQLQA